MTDHDETPVIDAPAGWDRGEDRFHREFTFDDFVEAFAFMTRVAGEAERLQHHPDWSNSYDTVTIDLISHDVGGLTERDVALAEAINAVAGV